MPRKLKPTAGSLVPSPDARPAAPVRLVADLRKLVNESRQAVAQTVNTALVWLYWNVGNRIRDDILKQKRADSFDGVEGIDRVSWKRFSIPNLSRIRREGH